MVTTNYIWNDDAVLMETDETGATTATYTREPDQFGSLISQHRSGQTHVHHYDALGSTTELTDSTETVTDTFRYSAFGNEVMRIGATQAPHTWVGRSGYERDTPIRFYVRRRHYSPSSATWHSPDPLGIVMGPCRYQYADNNPVLSTDPSGLINVSAGIKSRRTTCPPRRPNLATVKWTFSMFGPAPCNGFFVQQVTVRCSIGPCGRTPTADTYVYWEAWRVFQGRFKSAVQKSQDTFQHAIRGCTDGEYEQSGEIRFYCNTAMGIPATTISDVIPGWDPPFGARPNYPSLASPCSTTPGVLPSTGTKPGFWDTGRIVAYSYRWARTKWRCCPDDCVCDGDDTATVRIDNSP
jgi:RHS repeat-associated protein